ncbi:MAG TPA: protein-L-isoaspartate O-methyltransferase [Steroidobacteraceae bacterium]|nr:protein-L-isoaspartate O-methyltransferase [Steroidobacteraceae bacterium]
MDIEAARQQMIDQQVRAWEVLDPRVLDALARVPRERFVPPAYRDLAFADAPIPLPEGQSMLPPKLDARILQACEIVAGDTVIEVGAGSGFLAACLATLGGRVESLELRPLLAELANRNLRTAGFFGVAVHLADGTTWQPRAPVDVVVLSASLPVYDPRYEQWLLPGGRLFAVTGAAAPMTAQLVTRLGEREFARTDLFETFVDPMTNARRPSAFVF